MTDSLIKSIRLINPGIISSEVYGQVRKCFIDYLSVTISGSQTFSDKTSAYVSDMLKCEDGVSIIGLKSKTDMQTAALINGMNSHVIELDDGHRQGALHVGGTVFSALLAVAEKENLSSQDFLYGAIIGYEVSVRLACAVQPGT